MELELYSEYFLFEIFLIILSSEGIKTDCEFLWRMNGISSQIEWNSRNRVMTKLLNAGFVSIPCHHVVLLENENTLKLTLENKI